MNRQRKRPWDSWLAVCVLCSAACSYAQVSIHEKLTLTGTVESLTAGVVVVKDDKGTRHELRVQGPGDQGVALTSGALLAFPGDVKVTGVFDPATLKPGQIVRFEAALSRAGTSAGEVAEVKLLDAEGKPGIEWHAGPPNAAEQATCTVTAAVKQVAKDALVIEPLPGEEIQRTGAIRFKTAGDVRGVFESADPRRIDAGATVVECAAVRLDTGDVVVKSLVVRNPAKAAVEHKGDDVLAAKYQKLSNEPHKAPRDVRSAHFAFKTDLSDREAAILLDKLERMAGLLQNHFRRPALGVVNGFVVRDLDAWGTHRFEEAYGLEKIREGAGVCFNARLGDERSAVLYSCAKHGVIQHECMHGLCHMTFGATGPTWLAEGMAELGNYWRDGQREVDIDPAVVAYLQNSRPKKRLLEIAVPGRVDAGTWQDYAWRWALCHLLANNPNYAVQFQPLAIALMEERPGVSFESVYGPDAKQISFEYDLFLETVGNGYRADLVAWPWKECGRSRELKGGMRTTIPRVKAAAGWQATRVRVEQGVEYAVQTKGKWKTSAAGPAVTAAGDAAGHGRLLGVVFRQSAAGEWTLGQEFPVGDGNAFTAPEDGELFLRCGDAWTRLADNSGEIEVTVRRAAKP